MDTFAEAWEDNIKEFRCFVLVVIFFFVSFRFVSFCCCVVGCEAGAMETLSRRATPDRSRECQLVFYTFIFFDIVSPFLTLLSTSFVKYYYDGYILIG